MVDERVKRAMQRWPGLPPTFGWLKLTRRGHWLLEGDKRITHPRTVDFIGRNYLPDEQGQWYFQNGPQQVMVQLEYMPLILRLSGDREAGETGSLVTHTGLPVDHPDSAWLDEEGSLLLATEHGPALVEDRDLLAIAGLIADTDGQPIGEDKLADALEAFMTTPEQNPLSLRYAGRHLPLGMLNSDDVPQHFGFVPNPRPKE